MRCYMPPPSLQEPHVGTSVAALQALTPILTFQAQTKADDTYTVLTTVASMITLEALNMQVAEVTS